MKTCSKCGAPREGRCRPCGNAASAAYYAAHREERKASFLAWNAANPEKVRASAVAYRTANREKVRAAKAAYYIANREKRKAYDAAHHAANRERILAYQADRRADRRAANSEKTKAATAAWRAAHPGYDATRGASRSAVRAGAAVNDLTLEQWQALLAYYSNGCAYCEAPATEIDHVVPFSKGGDNTLSNVVPCCAPCNRSKSDKLLGDWMVA